MADQFKEGPLKLSTVNERGREHFQLKRGQKKERNYQGNYAIGFIVFNEDQYHQLLKNIKTRVIVGISALIAVCP